MMSSPNLAEFESWSSGRILTWCAELDPDTAPAEVNWWLALRWVTQFRVYDGALPIPERRDWAATTLQLTRAINRHTTYGWWNAAIDEVNLRCYMVVHLGQQPGDLEALLHVVTGAITLGPDEALALAAHWRDLPREQILLLRRHKNLLTPLARIADRLPDGPDADQVRTWFAVVPHLP